MRQHNNRVHNVKLQAGACVVLILLSTDSLNPVKALSNLLGVSTPWLALVWLAALVVVLYQNASDAIYFCIQTFFHSILSIFFKTIDIVGVDNIPQDGPVIFTGNHANQFVDGIMVMMNCNRKVGFLVAEKSWRRPIIGYLSQAVGCIPVVRPQDSVSQGVGTITMGSKKQDDKEEYEIIGSDTLFTVQVGVGDQVRYQGKSVIQSGSPVIVIEVIDDTHIIVASPVLTEKGEPVNQASFGIFKKVDQSTTFSKVYAHLKQGNCIGIFPEGGSHDRTDLLPLKAGVSIMAFGVKDKYGISAPVVPVGLNYFRGHRFRARVVIEFGSPIHIGVEELELYRQDKRKACNAFLARVEEGMRSVLVTAPDYKSLQLVYTARRLYQPSGIRLTPRATQDLNRRFAEGYKVLLNVPNPILSKELSDLRLQLEEYQKALTLMGLKDHQVPFIQWWNVHHVVSSLVYSVLVFTLASIPSFVLNAPVGLMARYAARQEQKKALADSKVKIAGRDVMLSKKILYSIVAVPALWISYFVLAVLLTEWSWSSIILLFLSCPLFSYFGVRTVEAGIIEFKTIRPLFYRLLPKYKSIQDELPGRRKELKSTVRAFIKKYQDILGDLAKEERMDWGKYMHTRKAWALDSEMKDELGKQPTLSMDRITAQHDLRMLSPLSSSNFATATPPKEMEPLKLE